MNTSAGSFLQHGKRSDPFPLTAFLLVTFSILSASGCAPKDDAISGSKPGSAAPAGGGSKAPTPQQEAARTRAEQQGPAIETALKQQQGK